MSIRLYPRSVAILSTGGSQFGVDIDHTEDSISLGDSTHTLTFLEASPGVWAMPVQPIGGGDASASNQTSGAQKTQIYDPVEAASAEVDDVGGEKALKVSVIASVGAAGGASATDTSNFTVGASLFAPIGAQYDADDSNTIADGKQGMVGMTATRHLKTYDAAVVALLTTQNGYLDGLEGYMDGVEGYLDGLETLIGTTNSSLTTLGGYMDGLEGYTDGLETLITSTNSLITTQNGYLDGLEGFVDGIEALIGTTNTNTGNAATSLAIMDDWDKVAAAAIGTDGVGVMGSDGTNARFLKTDTSGELQIDVLTLPALPSGTNNIGDVDVLSVTAAASTNKCDIGLINAVTPLMGNGSTGTGSLRVTIASDTTSNTNPYYVGGGAASGATIAGNPLQTGGRAQNANPTLVTNGQNAYMALDLAGRVIMTPVAPRELIAVQATTITASVTETTIVTATASVYHDLCQLVITNSSASALIVTLKDGTAGTTRGIFSLAANGGIVIPFPTPLVQSATNANWTITCGTSVSSIYVMAQYVTRN